MHLIAKTQQETWAAYEASDPGFVQVQQLIAEVGTIVANVGTLTVGQGRDYTSGSFDLTLGRLGVLANGMIEYCTTNQEVAADGWDNLFAGYVEDVEAEAERQRREDAAWGMLWDGLQIAAGVVIAAIGVGLTPFSAGFSLGLTVLGASLVVGGVNNMINHASIATTGTEFNIIGTATDQVAAWYDVNVAQPAIASGSPGLALLAGVGSGLGQVVSDAAQLNVAEVVTGVSALITDQNARDQLWAQITELGGKVASGDMYATGQILGNLIPLGAAAKLGKLNLFSKVDNLFSPNKLPTPSGGTSALDLAKELAGATGAIVRSILDDVKHALTDTCKGMVNGLDTIKQFFKAADPGAGGNNGPGAVEYPTGRLPKFGEPNSFGYDSDGLRLPYANSRPDYASGQVEQVWNNTRAQQIDDIEAGLDGSPPSVPGPDQLWVKDISGEWKLIEWRLHESRKNLWDMGHLPRAKYEDLRNQYLSGEITKERFLEEYRDPENYQVEDWLRNQSHIDE